MLQAHEITPNIIGPPTPAILDGVTFFARGNESEGAWVGADLVGDLQYDEQDNVWRFRSVLSCGDWHPARCRAEARAKIITAMRVRAAA